MSQVVIQKAESATDLSHKQKAYESLFGHFPMTVVLFSPESEEYAVLVRHHKSGVDIHFRGEPYTVKYPVTIKLF